VTSVNCYLVGAKSVGFCCLPVMYFDFLTDDEAGRILNEKTIERTEREAAKAEEELEIDPLAGLGLGL
jgi:hypothetical protein